MGNTEILYAGLVLPLTQPSCGPGRFPWIPTLQTTLLPLSSGPVERTEAGRAGRGCREGQLRRGRGGQAVHPRGPRLQPAHSESFPSQASISAVPSTLSPCRCALLLCVSHSPSSRKDHTHPRNDQVGRRDSSRNGLPARPRLSVGTFLGLQLKHPFPVRHF